MTNNNAVRVTDFKKENGQLLVTIQIYKSFSSYGMNHQFILKQRNGKKEINLTISCQVENKKFSIYEVTVSPPEHTVLFGGKQIWDLYIQFGVDKLRIKCREKRLEKHALLIPNKKQMFYPYTTKFNNLSFVLCNFQSFTYIEDFSIVNNNFAFRGYCYYPPFDDNPDYTLHSVKAIVSLPFHNKEIEVPLIISKEYKQKNSFSGELSLPNKVNGALTYQFFFILTYEKKVNLANYEEIRSSFSHAKEKSFRKVVRTLNHKKIKVSLSPKKNTGIYQLQISSYHLGRELITKTKTKSIRIRRSPFIRKVYSFFFFLIGKLPKKNLIVFESFHGKQFSCNPRAIYEYLNNFNHKYELVWSADRKHYQNFNVNSIRRFSIQWLLKMPRAKYWIVNSRLPVWLPKPRKTTYIQTWHGTPLKRLAADMEEVHMPGTNAEKYINNFLKEAQKWDYLISPNPYSSTIFRRAFAYTKPIIESGYPRNDFIVNNNKQETINRIKKNLHIPFHKKVILYAPTWRDDQFYAKGKYAFDLQLDLQLLMNKLHDNYVIILRLHYLIAENLDLSNFNGFAINLSMHEDIRDLYLIADVLITDYSSVFFDYANLKRPIIFFVYDIEKYRDMLRGFYFNFEIDAPGPLVKTTEEILIEIKRFERNDFLPSPQMEQFYQKFCSLEDGCASERVVRAIFKS